MAKKISQSKIAKELGVSQSLVSIVLNGRKEGIAQKTYERIWNFALQHGYSPKGMRMDGEDRFQRVRTVGYFLRSPLRLANKSNFFSHITQGLHDYLQEQHVNMVFLGSEMDFDPEEMHRIGWQKQLLQGIIIMGEVEPAFLAAVRELDKPLVYISARSPGLCHSVNSNEYDAAEKLVDHLHEMGHRHFAYFGSRMPPSRNRDRLEGLQLALRRHRLSLPAENILIDEDAERKEGYRLAEKLLAAPPDPFPTAWICVNGLMARGALSQVYQAGLALAGDVSIAAFDNTRVCSEELPGITGASAVPEELGREAGRIVLHPELHEDHQLLDVVLPSRFAQRESTGPAPAANKTTLKV
jgi:LacI family transcriptional regulator